MRIEVLAFEGCPNAEPAVQLARDVALEMGMDPEIELIPINGLDAAQTHRFLGSPSIRNRRRGRGTGNRAAPSDLRLPDLPRGRWPVRRSRPCMGCWRFTLTLTSRVADGLILSAGRPGVAQGSDDSVLSSG